MLSSEGNRNLPIVEHLIYSLIDKARIIGVFPKKSSRWDHKGMKRSLSLGLASNACDASRIAFVRTWSGLIRRVPSATAKQYRGVRYSAFALKVQMVKANFHEQHFPYEMRQTKDERWTWGCNIWSWVALLTAMKQGSNGGPPLWNTSEAPAAGWVGRDKSQICLKPGILTELLVHGAVYARAGKDSDLPPSGRFLECRKHLVKIPQTAPLLVHRITSRW
jgi:hypothetical protein